MYLFCWMFFPSQQHADLNGDSLTTLVQTTILHILAGCAYKAKYIILFYKKHLSIKLISGLLNSF